MKPTGKNPLSAAAWRMLHAYATGGRWNGKQWSAAATLLKHGLIAFDAEGRGPFITDRGRDALGLQQEKAA